MIYFTPDASSAYTAIGISSPRAGYFLSRSSAMGAVSADVVIATFFNFHPGLVRRAMENGWATAAPETVTAARLDAVDASLRRAFGPELLGSAELGIAAELTRRAALVACEHPEGRPLFAGHASLPWPDEAHLVVWHAQTLLREFRGDGRVAALTLAGLSGLDALLSHAGSGDVPAEVLRHTGVERGRMGVRAHSSAAWLRRRCRRLHRRRPGSAPADRRGHGPCHARRLRGIERRRGG